ncbi:uncharacterized protein LOC111297787 [Durio zibethinus]|uniref:Uncharacterized protein LOC111297787 n=1 Tax=Durio zibethinus TaxID=66656 RepID=A0A6P5Z6F8_DURZI|nr:uncharacterized protein LOC111297787 [Durio zibethinus]
MKSLAHEPPPFSLSCLIVGVLSTLLINKKGKTFQKKRFISCFRRFRLFCSFKREKKHQFSQSLFFNPVLRFKNHKIILRTTPSVQRRKPLLRSRFPSSSSVDDFRSSTRSSSRNSAKFGEFCGGTTAECAAICCCCPCGIANLLVLAIFKVPAGLCRRALHHKRRRNLQKKGLLQRGHCECHDTDLHIHPVVCLEDFFLDKETSEEDEKAVLELEKEMWQRFYGTGFWRSPSQREGESPRIKQL